MKSSLGDNLLEVKLTFLYSLTSEWELFLTIFQSEAPMVPFLYDSLEDILLALVEKICELGADETVLEVVSKISGCQYQKLMYVSKHMSRQPQTTAVVGNSAVSLSNLPPLPAANSNHSRQPSILSPLTETDLKLKAILDMGLETIERELHGKNAKFGDIGVRVVKLSEVTLGCLKMQAAGQQLVLVAGELCPSGNLAGNSNNGGVVSTYVATCSCNSFTEFSPEGCYRIIVAVTKRERCRRRMTKEDLEESTKVGKVVDGAGMAMTVVEKQQTAWKPCSGGSFIVISPAWMHSEGRGGKLALPSWGLDLTTTLGTWWGPQYALEVRLHWLRSYTWVLLASCKSPQPSERPSLLAGACSGDADGHQTDKLYRNYEDDFYSSGSGQDKSPKSIPATESEIEEEIEDIDEVSNISASWLSTVSGRQALGAKVTMRSTPTPRTRVPKTSSNKGMA
ncbi:hypothetical protein PR048_029418 [Dryococelus australis]|uniref:Uncharacterized protein n=1 Tax=Dryococelus australis TaxID=614101 RepID=A0ABQ9GDB1_9NEOP|nr:hypothetical protein PR048_029418 [Dryococelus australis]